MFEDFSAANNVLKFVYLKNEGNFYIFICLDEMGVEFCCVMDVDDIFSCGFLGWRKILIMCDVLKEVEGEEIFVGVKFIFVTLVDGKIFIYS